MVVVVRLLVIAVAVAGAALGSRPPADPVAGGGSAAVQGTGPGAGTGASVPGMPGSEPEPRQHAGPPPEGKDPGGLSDPRMAEVAARVLDGRQVDKDVARVVDDRIRVEVIAREGVDPALAVRAVSGRVIGVVGSLALADIPARRILELESRADIVHVRLPVEVGAPAENVPAADPTETGAAGTYGADAIVRTNVDSWHLAGQVGAGVKVGIIDEFNLAAWQRAAQGGELPAAVDGFCQKNGTPCGPTMFNTAEVHGVAVAEVVMDMAPGATLYLATVRSVIDVQAAIDWFAANGVRIIARSLTAKYDGPGDGTGDLATVMASAVSKGMAWFNSAGNSARGPGYPGTYFRSAWSDPNLNGWMNFPDGGEYLAFDCSFINGLRWNDWGANRTDYDIYVYESPDGSPPLDSSRLDQQVGLKPIELLPQSTVDGCSYGNDTQADPWDYVAIFKYADGNGTAGDVLEFMTNGYFVGFAQTMGSATAPAADTRTPGTAAVGAVEVDHVIAPYSSQGPSNDGRLRPDLSAATDLASLTYPDGFSGTSAATPAVAGAAAVVLGSSPGMTPVQLVDWMKAHTVDLGTPGPDNAYGVGELIMPTIQVPISLTSLTVFPVARQLSDPFPVQVSWATSVPQSRAVVGRRSATSSPYEIFAQPTGEQSVSTSVRVGQPVQFAVNAGHSSGSNSGPYETSLLTPVVFDDRHRKVDLGRGWSEIRFKGASRRTLSAARVGSKPARFTFQGTAASVVVTRSPNSAKLEIVLDGKRIGTANLRSKKVRNRQIVANFLTGGAGRHHLTLKPVGKRGRSVFLDAFVVLG